MPELPEVETVVRTLEKQIQNDTITDIEIYYDRIIGTDIVSFKQNLIGKTFTNFSRRGKFLVFGFQDSSKLIVHLRMEGKFYITQALSEIDMKHIHVVFKLQSNRYLCYQDTRKFGRLYYTQTTIKELEKLGYEPFDNDLTVDLLWNMVQNSKEDLKSFLLNQNNICGIGNIYANEICFQLKIDPRTKINRLSYIEVENLLAIIRSTLEKAIAAGGTTIRSYTSSLHVTGRFQLQVLVHDKNDEPCTICGNTIKKIMWKTRGTYICETCQKSKKIIAITGTIGSGKSTVKELLRKQGYYVLDADEIQHELSKMNGVIYNDLVATLGDSILLENKEINREYLRNLVFNSKEIKEKVEEINFHYILDELKKRSNACLTFWEIPLLFEAGWDKYVDASLLVTCSNKTAMERVQKRSHLSTSQIKKIIQAQMPVAEKKEKATYIIKNDADIQTLENNLRDVLKKIEGGE